LDKHFLEFWGNFLLSAAKGQRQLEEFSRWMSQGMSGFRDLSRLFQQFYDLGSERPEGDQDWQTARASFEKAYRAYLDALGVVPKSDYLALQKELEVLRQHSEEQEAALRKLRLELSESRMAQGDVVRGFQELIQVQSEQFQELTESFNRLFTGRPEKEPFQK
jgi:hypothetical protein